MNNIYVNEFDKWSQQRKWERQIQTEYNVLSEELFGRFWKDRFYKICENYSFEFDLNNKITSDYLMDFFSVEILKLIIATKMELDARSNRNDDFIFKIKYPDYGLPKTPEIVLSISQNSLYLRIEPGAPVSKTFALEEYKNVLKIIIELIQMDLSELIQSVNGLKSDYWLSEKNAEIAACSISSVCNSLLGTAGINFSLQNYALISVLRYEDQMDKWNQKILIHKEFNDNPEKYLKELHNIIEE